MIHKLRKKFILINMMLVGAVLLVVFCAVCLSTHHRLREDSLNAMRQAVSYPFDEKFPSIRMRLPNWLMQRRPTVHDRGVCPPMGCAISSQTTGTERRSHSQTLAVNGSRCSICC